MDEPQPEPVAPAWDPVLENVADLTPFPTVVMDAGLRVVAWNAAAEQELRYSRAEMLGAHCISGIRCQACLGSCPILAGVTAPTVVRVFRKDGSQATFEREGRVIYGPSGEVRGVLETLRPCPASSGVEVERLGTLEARSPAMIDVLRRARRLVTSPVAVLVEGETGTGKARLVRAMHTAGDRSEHPLIRIPCTPELALDWDYAMTDSADATLFLDHVECLSMEQQQALARSWPASGGPRILATTSVDLAAEARAGRFDPGLFYRVRGAHLQLPTLRDRIDEMPELARQVVEAWCERWARSPRTLTSEAIACLQAHDWPGNLRELEGCLGQALTTSSGPTVRPEHLGLLSKDARRRREQPPEQDLARRIRVALGRTDGRVSEAAELLGMSRSTFWRARKRLGL